MRPKGGSHLVPKARWVPKPQLNPPERKLVTNPLDPKLAKDLLDTNLAINPVGPIFDHGPPWRLATTRGHQIISVSLPLDLWGIPSIPSYHLYLRLQEDYLAHQSDNLWRQAEDSSRIPTTCICRSWVGTLFRIIQRANSQNVLHQCNQLSRHQVFQYSLDNSIHLYRPHQSACMALAQLGHFIIHCGNSITQFKFQDGQNCISRFRQ
ncbi:hypothetical protein O181_097665 [Austropuccinia psidii MF-1]|uniref:Uncharacterized protein n=1 Tax=Austropuccinia psidii MF-1 TaxID=1389203 RepID=A0A9Q3JA12_9BASI|nr:hypothetical protein [Austropuccinia psidii MF-1]